jgi:hypothetical protein
MDLEINIDNLHPLKGKILVDEIDTGERVHNGVIRLSDNMKDSGIRPRWCHVFKVADDIDFVQPGDWILVDHGRWSRGIPVVIDGVKKNLRLVENHSISVVSDTNPLVD